MNVEFCIMKNYTEDQLEDNYNKFIKLIESSFTGDRLEKLLKLYGEEEYGYRLTISPAAFKDYVGYCYPGGYLDLIFNLHKAAIGTKKLWEMVGCIIDFSDEELIFSVMGCNLGLLGDKDCGEYFVVNDNDWRIKNMGELYKINSELQHMLVSDRSLYILQKYNINMTGKEYLAIRLNNGMYNEGNKSYLYNFSKDMDLKTNLPHILHQAGFLAYKVGSDCYKQENS